MRCRQKGAKEASDETQEEKYLLESKSTAFLGEGLPKQQQCESWNKRFSWFPSPTTPHRLMWELKIVSLELFGLLSERASLILKANLTKTSIMIAVVMKITMVKMMYMYYLWNKKHNSYWSRASLFTWHLLAPFFTDPCSAPDLCTHPYHQCHVVGGKALCVCPMVITANLAPVCGSDGQTYPNPSALESMSCLANRIVEAEYSGECRGE